MARPRLRVETVPHARDKTITLIRYRRSPDSPIWEAEITLPDGTKKIVSTKESDLSAAQFAAVEAKTRVLGKVADTGSPALRTPPKPKLPTFNDAADRVIADIQAMRATEAHDQRQLSPDLLQRRLHRHQMHIARINNDLRSAFGAMTYLEVNPSVVRQFVQGYRIVPRGEEDVTANEVMARQSTIGNLAHTYGKVMAQLRDMSNAVADYPAMSKAGMPAEEPRESFSDEEAEILVKAMTEEWMDEPKRARNKAIRRLLRPYIHICATTGIRPGLGMELLTFGHIAVLTDRLTKRQVTQVHVPRVKIKHSYAAVPHVYDRLFNFDNAVKELIEFHGGADPSQLLFELPAAAQEDRHGKSDRVTRRTIPAYSRTFAELLTALNLRTSIGSTKPRTLYSLRHYYANTQIMLDRDIYKLAVRMGTSVAMIERYYGKTITRRDAGMAAGLHDPQREKLSAMVNRDRVSPILESDLPEVHDQHELDLEVLRERYPSRID